MNWRIIRGTKDPISGEALVPPGEAPAPRFDDLGFEHSYECEVLPSTANEKDGPLVIPDSTPTGERASCDCLVIRVRPESGPPWKAAFFGEYQIDAFPQGVFALPDPDSRDVPFRVDLRDGSHTGGWGLDL